MFIPPAFAEPDLDVVEAMLARAPLAVLTTVRADGQVEATHLPMLWDRAAGVLIGHVARANPQGTERATRGLAIFQGPSAYVSPSFYHAKGEHGRVVPTWNYEAVHMRGALEWTLDAGELRAIVEALTDRFEAAFPSPWRVSDAPDDYLRAMLANITGVRLRIETIEAKRKLSQNRAARDREGVIAGLGGHPVAALMRSLPK